MMEKLPEKFQPKPADLEQAPGADISKMARVYIDLPKDKLEVGIKNLLDVLKKPSEENQATEFLKGMLNLEMYYDLRTIPERRQESEAFLNQVFESLAKVIEKEKDFQIKIKGGNNKEIDFGNISLSHAYLGDLFVEKYLKDGNLENWQKADRLYREAINLERDPGLANELKTISNIRKMAKTLGNEKETRCRKTTRREDLRNQAADLFLEYEDQKNKKTYSSYIDVTGELSAEKQQKQKYSPTYVAAIPEKVNNFIASLNFDQPFIVEEKKPSRVTMNKIQEMFSAFIILSSKLADALGLKTSEKINFGKSFWMDENKLLKFFPLMDKEEFIKKRSQWWRW